MRFAAVPRRVTRLQNKRLEKVHLRVIVSLATIHLGYSILDERFDDSIRFATGLHGQYIDIIIIMLCRDAGTTGRGKSLCFGRKYGVTTKTSRIAGVRWLSRADGQ